MPGESYRRRLGSSFICLCYVFWRLINFTPFFFFFFFFFDLLFSVLPSTSLWGRLLRNIHPSLQHPSLSLVQVSTYDSFVCFLFVLFLFTCTSCTTLFRLVTVYTFLFVSFVTFKDIGVWADFQINIMDSGRKEGVTLFVKTYTLLGR